MNQQKEQMKTLFYDESVHRLTDLISIGIYVSYKQLLIFWEGIYGVKLVLEREESLQKVVAKEREKLLLQPKSVINTFDNTSLSFNFEPFVKLKNNLLASNKLVPEFTKNPYLNIVKYNFDLRNGICPICEEHFNISFYDHLRIKQYDRQHQPLLYQQIELAIRLFYDLTYISDDQNDFLHFYFSYSVCRDILWPYFFSQKENKIRKSHMFSIGFYHKYKNKSEVQTLNKWKFVRKNKHSFNKMMIVDWSIFDKNRIKDEQLDIFYNKDFIESINKSICPICGKTFKRSFFDHLKLSRKDDKHNEVFVEQVKLAVQMFYVINNEDYECLFLSPFSTCTDLIWKNIFTEDEINNRNKKIGTTTSGWGCIQGYRKDIDYFVRSTWEANVYRIFKYVYKDKYKESFDREIPFDISTPKKNKVYIVDIKDNFGFFAKPNTYIEIKGFYTTDVHYKTLMFEKLYPDKKLIFISHDEPKFNFVPEIYYSDLEKKYQPLIPLWETKDRNLKTHPWLYL